MKKSFSVIVVVISIVSLLLVAAAVYYVARTARKIEQRMRAAEIKQADISSGSATHTKKTQKIAAFKDWGQLQSQLNNTVVQVFSQVAEIDILQPHKTPTQGQGVGSAFFINEEGDLITNAHVVDQARAVWIQIPGLGKRQIDVEVIGAAPEYDLALLKIKPEGLALMKRELGAVPYLELGDSDTVHRADEIMALGYPLGQQGLKSTTGVVSGRERHYIQISAPINPGSSGGPSINDDGEVIGINSAGIFGGAQNVGYAIPVNDLKVILKDLRTTPLVRKPNLGMFYVPASDALTEFLCNPQPGGLYVVDVQKGSQLDKNGVKAGDMLYEINGHQVDIFGETYIPALEDKVSVVDYIARLALGQKVHLVLYRKGTRIEVDLTFKFVNPQPVCQIFPGYDRIDYEIVGGMLLQQLTLNHLPLLVNNAPSLTRYAEPKYQTKPVIIVTHIFADSQAHRSRALAPGHIITQLNGEKIGTLADVRAALPKSLDSSYLTIETNDSRLVVFPLTKVLSEEPRLARGYSYTITPGIKALLDKVGTIKEEAASPAEEPKSTLPQPVGFNVAMLPGK